MEGLVCAISTYRLLERWYKAVSRKVCARDTGRLKGKAIIYQNSLMISKASNCNDGYSRTISTMQDQKL